MKTDAGNWLEVVCIFTLFFVKQSTEVPNSNAMELESLKQQLLYLDQENVNVEKLVNDRHSQVSSYMVKEKPTIKHYYDVWHLAKGKNC